MKYDLSKVPRALHDRSLRCWFCPTTKCWAVYVGNDDFGTNVAEVHDRHIASELVKEINSILKAHRLLAGKSLLADSFTP